jgi:CheY-like chemotaxis protein
VLIVEDDDPTREMMRRMLEDEGWVVNEAPNGRIGLDSVARSRPELILLDLMMPEVDGFQFLNELRQNPDPEIAALPVVVVTARDLSPDERASLSGNVEKIIQKGGQTQSSSTVLAEIRDQVRMHLHSDQLEVAE